MTLIESINGAIPTTTAGGSRSKRGSEKQRIFSCNRRFDHNDIRNGGVYYVTAKVADEYTADTSTTASIAPGGYLTGGFYQDNGSNRDEDWVKVNLTAGNHLPVYTPGLHAAPGGPDNNRNLRLGRHHGPGTGEHQV